MSTELTLLKCKLQRCAEGLGDVAITQKLLKRTEFDQKTLKPGQSLSFCGAQETAESWAAPGGCPSTGMESKHLARAL